MGQVVEIAVLLEVCVCDLAFLEGIGSFLQFFMCLSFVTKISDLVSRAKVHLGYLSPIQ